MIVNYLVRMGMGLEEAILSFAQARPPGIYKHYYLRRLFRYHHAPGLPPRFPLPPPPPWKAGSSPDHGDEEEEEEGREAEMHHDDVVGEQVCALLEESVPPPGALLLCAAGWRGCRVGAAGGAGRTCRLPARPPARLPARAALTAPAFLP